MEKLASALRGNPGVTAVNSALIEPELNRRKQPLEAYPLDTMSMVGSLDRQGQLVALVRVDALLYQVRPGSYLGQNYGRVKSITETEIVLREIVQDSAGEWIERPAALQLQEDASKCSSQTWPPDAAPAWRAPHGVGSSLPSWHSRRHGLMPKTPSSP